MIKQLIKSPIRTKVIKDVHPNGEKSKSRTRIDEAGLFNHFTADIMKMKIKFTR